MDTATHFAMGFGLAALAHLDPVVAATPSLAQAVMVGTVIGSQAPDLDGFTRLKSSAAYTRYHRGVSHSIPALFLWTLAIFGFIQIFSPQLHWAHLLGWTFLAVCLHVFVDLFNAYGTQGFRPFSQKWISFNTIFIFDAFIFALHIFGFLLWGVGADPGVTFLTIYFVIAVYYLKRFRDNRRATAVVQQALDISGEYTVIPTFFWNQWAFIIKNDTHWHVGEYTKGSDPMLLDQFVCKPESELIARAKQDHNVQAFLDFTNYAHVEVKEQEFGYEVRWFDLRYRARIPGKSHYMFVAVVYIDHEYQVRDSFVGWIHRGEEQLAKKLDPEKRVQAG